MAIRKQALKPKMKSLKVRAKRLKADMGKIKEDQKCIREVQRDLGEKFEEVKRHCHQLKEETEVIIKQTACTRIRLVLMFNILRAREDGDFEKAANLTRFLKIVSDGSKFKLSPSQAGN